MGLEGRFSVSLTVCLESSIEGRLPAPHTRRDLVLEHPILLDTLLCVEIQLPLRVVRRILQSSVPGSSSTATEHAALAQTWPPVPD